MVQDEKLSNTTIDGSRVKEIELINRYYGVTVIISGKELSQAIAESKMVLAVFIL